MDALKVLAELLEQRDRYFKKQMPDYPTMTAEQYMEYAVGMAEKLNKSSGLQKIKKMI